MSRHTSGKRSPVPTIPFTGCRDADNEVRRYLRSVSRLKGLILNLITPFKPFKRVKDAFPCIRSRGRMKCVYPQYSTFSNLPTSASILEKAKSFLPRSLRDAPRWYISLWSMMRKRSWEFLRTRNSIGAYCAANLERSFLSAGFNFSE